MVRLDNGVRGMIDYILSDANDKILERDYLSEAASAELIIACVTGIESDEDKAKEAIQGIWKSIKAGQTVRIQHPDTKVSMIFQIPSLKKERDAHTQH